LTFLPWHFPIPSHGRAGPEHGGELHQPGATEGSHWTGNTELIQLPPPGCACLGVCNSVSAPCRSWQKRQADKRVTKSLMRGKSNLLRELEGNSEVRWGNFARQVDFAAVLRYTGQT